MYGLVVHLRALLIGIFATVGLLFCPASHALVISQIYGGGGNSGATYTHDFIEIFNDSATAFDLSAVSVQYSSASLGSSWHVTDLSGLPDPFLDPYHYFLVQEAAGGGGSTPLPTADAVGSLALSASSGKVALAYGSGAIAPGCGDALIIDVVGYGGAECFEGSAAATSPSNTLAALRLLDGLMDSGENSTDFTIGPPNPRNSSSQDNPPADFIAVSEPSSLLLMFTGLLLCKPRLRRGVSSKATPRP